MISSQSKNMKLIIIWDQVAACWKIEKDITFCRDKLSIIYHLSPQLLDQKQGFNQHGGINQKTKRAQETPGAKNIQVLCFAWKCPSKHKRLELCAQHEVFSCVQASYQLLIHMRGKKGMESRKIAMKL